MTWGMLNNTFTVVHWSLSSHPLRPNLKLNQKLKRYTRLWFIELKCTFSVCTCLIHFECTKRTSTRYTRDNEIVDIITKQLNFPARRIGPTYQNMSNHHIDS